MIHTRQYRRRAEAIFPGIKEGIKQIVHRKPHIVILNHIQSQCTTVERTVSYEFYLENAYELTKRGKKVS